MKPKKTSSHEEKILTDDIPDHLHPNVKRYWLITNLIGMLVILASLILPFVAIAIITGSIYAGLAIFSIFAIMAIMMAVITIVFINMTYDNITYLVKNEALIINRGIFFKQSQTIPFNRVQNVDIYWGPIERRFGIATINVQTAGWGGNILRGRLQGIDNPEFLRGIILKRVIRTKNNGL